MVEEEKIRKNVRERYAKMAREGLCCSSSTSCCESSTIYEEQSKKIGYTEEELKSIPRGSNLGQGCGNPVALVSLRAGKTVIDLGSGGGVDCFLAAKKVGAKGRVIGVDMTPEMIDKARKNALKGNYGNVEFRLGEIENLPVADNTADVIISNCVITFIPNKKRVYEEAFRVLKPGGRLVVSDLVLTKELPTAIKERTHPASSIQAAMMKDKYIETIEQVGFQDIKLVNEKQYCYFEDIADNQNAKIIARASISVSAIKPSSERAGR